MPYILSQFSLFRFCGTKEAHLCQYAGSEKSWGRNFTKSSGFRMAASRIKASIYKTDSPAHNTTILLSALFCLVLFLEVCNLYMEYSILYIHILISFFTTLDLYQHSITSSKYKFFSSKKSLSVCFRLVWLWPSSKEQWHLDSQPFCSFTEIYGS